MAGAPHAGRQGQEERGADDPREGGEECHLGERRERPEGLGGVERVEAEVGEA